RPFALDPPAVVIVIRQRAEIHLVFPLHLRALADYDNYRRRVERERSSAAREGKREIILPLLDVLDDFDRALEHMAGAPAPFVEGFQAVRRKVLGLLASHGVTPLSSVGEMFNPELHDAVGTVDSEEVEPNTVAEELQRGYRWGDGVLRPARVRVAQ
ncbi:MAG TPA: nucleotide exchange factor GrpE, partial [Candidatus Binatia bacterium]|nr:nucleotide exchange factor GrpE [Candidatus Binatia bacterium]